MAIELPLPENLLNIFEAEKEMREQILVAIGADEISQDHLKIINYALAIIKIVLERRHQNDEELIQQGLAARIYNDINTCLDLMFSGYYQVSCMPQRDFIECSLLLLKFTLDQPAIFRWKTNSDAQEFRAVEIRKYLAENARELPAGFLQGISATYAGLSKRGIHPHYTGMTRMLMKDAEPQGNLFWGPFLDLAKLRIMLSAFALDIGFATYAVVSAFDNIADLSPELKIPYGLFLFHIHNWMQKYWSEAISHVSNSPE